MQTINWVCLDCGGVKFPEEMATRVTAMETIYGDPVGRCKECDLVFEPEPYTPNSRWQQFKILLYLLNRKRKEKRGKNS